MYYNSTEKFDYDIIVVGCGIAGLTLLHHLPNHLKVAAVEAGSKSYSKKINTNDYGKSIRYGNFPVKNYSSNFTSIKALGGNNNIWSGWSIPLREEIFDQWPIKHNEIKEFYNLAEKFLGFESFDKVNNEELIKKKFNQYSLIVKNWQFADQAKFKSNISSLEKKVEFYLESKFKRFLVNDNKVDGIEIIKNDKLMKIKSKFYVFTTGGLETTRVLLESKKYLQRVSIGDESGQLGLNYMEHPHISLGTFEDKNNIISEKFQKKLNKKKGLFYTPYRDLDNYSDACITLDNNELLNAADAIKLIYSLRLKTLPKNMFNFKSILKFIPNLTAASITTIKNFLLKKKNIYARFEQRPNKDSKIFLDLNGKLILNWELHYKDIENMIKFLEIVKNYFKNNLGYEINVNPELIKIKENKIDLKKKYFRNWTSFRNYKNVRKL